MQYKFLLISCLFVVGESFDCSNQDSRFMDIKIRKKILCDYDKNIRPQEQVNVLFDFIFKSFDFSDSSNTMTVQSWITLRWNDSRLTWNPSEYEDNFKTYASFDLLWVPDITLLESNIMDDVNSCTAVDCNIYYTGFVECPLPCEHSAYCDDADHANWPFDTASCQFTYMSRTQSMKKMQILGPNLTVDTEFSSLNRAWELRLIYGLYGNQTSAFVVSSQEPNATYSFIKMNFAIKRHSPEMIYQVLIPAAVVAIMSIFTLLLEARLTERWILFVFGIFCNWIYTVQLQYMLPSNSDSVPKIFAFFCDSQILATFLMLQSLLLKIYIESEEDELTRIQWIMNFLKRTWYGQVIVYQETVDNVAADKLTFRLNVSRLFDRILIFSIIILYSIRFYELTSMVDTDVNFDKVGNFVLESDY